MFASCFPLEKELNTEVRERLNIFSNQILGYSTWFFKKLLSIINNITIKSNKTLIEMPNDYGSFCRFNRNCFVNYMTFCTSTNWTEVDAYYMSSRAPPNGFCGFKMVSGFWLPGSLRYGDYGLRTTAGRALSFVRSTGLSRANIER